jgi:hypothetical protein
LYSKPLLFVVISLLVVPLIYGPTSTFSVPNRSNSVNCAGTGGQSAGGLALVRCCWQERVAPGTGNPDLGGNIEIYCSECEDGGTRGKINCSDPELQYRGAPKGTLPPLEGGVLEDPLTPSPSGPAPPIKGGVLEQLEQGSLPELGFSERQQQPPADQGVAEQPPATEGAQPATVEEEPVSPCPEGQILNEETGLCVLEDCPEGQVLDEESNLCVLEEPEAAEEPEQAESSAPEQPESEDSGTEEENN